MSDPQALIINVNETFPLLRRSPLIEAVIHWQAHANKRLEPETLKTELSHRLPDYPSIQTQQGLQVQASGTPDGTSQVIHQTQWNGFRLQNDSKIWLGKVCQECYDNEDTEDESSDSEDEEEPNKDDLYHGDEWINKAGLRHYYCKGCDEVVPITGWGCRPASDTLCESCEDEPVKIDYNKYPKKTHLLT